MRVVAHIAATGTKAPVVVPLHRTLSNPKAAISNPRRVRPLQCTAIFARAQEAFTFSQRLRKLYDISENGAKSLLRFLYSRISKRGPRRTPAGRPKHGRSFSRCAARGVVGDSLPVNLCAAELTSLSNRPGAETHKHP